MYSGALSLSPLSLPCQLCKFLLRFAYRKQYADPLPSIASEIVFEGNPRDRIVIIPFVSDISLCKIASAISTSPHSRRYEKFRLLTRIGWKLHKILRQNVLGGEKKKEFVLSCKRVLFFMLVSFAAKGLTFQCIVNS